MAAPININANLNLNSASINASAKQVQQALGRITGQASEFQKSLDASTARVFAFGATTAVINGVTQSFKALVSTTVNVQAKLTEINSILGAGAKEFNQYRNSIFNVAKQTGQSFDTVAGGAAELARQGLGAEESAKRLKAALILTRISGLGAEQSVKALTAAMNGFTSAGLTAEQIVNKIVAVDTAFAVSAQDLADGFSRAGSTAEDAGVKFEELLALITAVEQRTARGGAVIGNAFKSIFTRISRGSTIDQLKELGVAINANQTGIQKLKALSQALENISDPTIASEIKELAGGVFQINVVSSTLKDLSSETSVFGKATKTAFSEGNAAMEKNAFLQEDLLAKLNVLTVTVTSLGERLGNLTIGPALKSLLSLGTSLAEGIDKALDPEKGNKFVQGLFSIIGKFISGPGLAIFSVAFFKIFKMVLKFAKDGFKSLMQMGSAAEKVKNIEGGIVDLLQRDLGLRKKLENSSLTQAQKEKAVWML
jgi:TP901 family phage tail tape measure protein